MQCWCGFCKSFAPSWPFVRCWLGTEFEMQRLGSEIAHETWWRMWQIYANLWMLVDVRYALLPISAYRYLYCTCMCGVCGVCVCAMCWCDLGVCIWPFICYWFIIHMHMHAYIKVRDEPNNCLDATVRYCKCISRCSDWEWHLAFHCWRVKAILLVLLLRLHFSHLLVMKHYVMIFMDFP